MIKDNIVTILVALALLGGAVWWISSGGDEAVAIPSADKTSGPTLELVERIKNIKLDISFLNDPQFLDLEVAPKTDITGVQKGRSNPFCK